MINETHKTNASKKGVRHCSVVVVMVLRVSLRHGVRRDWLSFVFTTGISCIKKVLTHASIMMKYIHKLPK